MVLVLKTQKESWRTTEAWCRKRSGEAIGERPALVLVKALGVIWRESPRREIEALHHMAGLESQKKAQIAIIKGEVYAEWRPQHFRDASTIGRS